MQLMKRNVQKMETDLNLQRFQPPTRSTLRSFEQNSTGTSSCFQYNICNYVLTLLLFF